MKNLIWKSSPVRGLLAGLIFSWLLMIIFTPVYRSASTLVSIVLFTISNILTGVIAGTLIRFQGFSGKEIRHEIRYCIILLLSHVVGSLLLFLCFDLITFLRTEIPFAPWLWLLSPPAYIGMRLVAYVWIWWQKKRQERILYEMIHTHMIVAVVVGGIFFVIGTSWIISGVISDRSIWSNVSNPGYSLFTAVTIWTLMLVMLTAAILVLSALILLLPSYLLSSRMSRQITHRIEELDRVAQTLKAGDMSASSVVDGEDEIARLQLNFNAMAASIQNYAATLEAEKEKVSDLLDAQKRLTVNVSHELRTPVTTLQAYLDSMQTHWHELDDAAIHHDLEIISQEVTQLKVLMDDLFLLNTARIRKLDFHCQTVDTGNAITSAVQALAPAIWHTSRIDLQASIPEQTLYAYADAARLSQIVKNLVTNSAQHTRPGGFINIEVTAEEEHVCIHVIDSGEGIPPEALQHIWEPFYKAGNKSSGAGLGLALVKEFTEMMGGSVSVESQPNEGATFTIKLPRRAFS